MPAKTFRPSASGAVLRRQRVVALAAVGVCLVGDLSLVAWSAAAREPTETATAPAPGLPPGAGASPRAPGATSATAPGTRSEDPVEQVPESPPPATADARVVQRGTGQFTPVAAPVPAGAVAAPPGARVVRYTVEVEGGVVIDRAAFGQTVGAVLGDGRGWQAVDRVRFVNVSVTEATAKVPASPADLRIMLASPDTTDRLCAPLRTLGQVSCHAGGGKVVLNLRRWVLGAPAYGTDLAAYRTYLVNHEVGHGLGHGHVSCAGQGKPAPVMHQQTYGLGGCTAWPWPSA